MQQLDPAHKLNAKRCVMTLLPTVPGQGRAGSRLLVCSSSTSLHCLPAGPVVDYALSTPFFASALGPATQPQPEQQDQDNPPFLCRCVCRKGKGKSMRAAGWGWGGCACVGCMGGGHANNHMRSGRLAARKGVPPMRAGLRQNTATCAWAQGSAQHKQGRKDDASERGASCRVPQEWTSVRIVAK